MSSDMESIMRNARLELTEEEKRRMGKELTEILEFFSKISEVDVEGTEPSFQPVPIKGVLREDEPKEGLTQKEALANCASTKDGFIKGPRI